MQNLKSQHETRLVMIKISHNCPTTYPKSKTSNSFQSARERAPSRSSSSKSRDSSQFQTQRPRSGPISTRDLNNTLKLFLLCRIIQQELLMLLKYLTILHVKSDLLPPACPCSPKIVTFLSSSLCKGPPHCYSCSRAFPTNLTLHRKSKVY